jgi:hypothetical protein
MRMTPEQFELACLECTLRTLRLRPRDILLTDDRLLANQNDPLLDVARLHGSAETIGSAACCCLPRTRLADRQFIGWRRIR